MMQAIEQQTEAIRILASGLQTTSKKDQASENDRLRERIRELEYKKLQSLSREVPSGGYIRGSVPTEPASMFDVGSHTPSHRGSVYSHEDYDSPQNGGYPRKRLTSKMRTGSLKNLDSPLNSSFGQRILASRQGHGDNNPDYHNYSAERDYDEIYTERPTERQNKYIPARSLQFDTQIEHSDYGNYPQQQTHYENPSYRQGTKNGRRKEASSLAYLDDESERSRSMGSKELEEEQESGHQRRKKSRNKTKAVTVQEVPDEDDDTSQIVRKKGRKKTVKKHTIVKSSGDLADTQKQRKIKARTRMQAFGWAMAYTRIILAHTYRRVERRKTIAKKSIIDAFTFFGYNAQEFFIENVGKQIKAFYGEKKSMVLVSGQEKGMFGGGKKVSMEEQESRIKNLIMPKMRAMLDATLSATTEAKFPLALSSFIATITENQSAPPERFLLDFEINRLSFTHFGTMKDMTEDHSKMIIGMFVLVRIMIYQFFVMPWTEIRKGVGLAPPPKDSLAKLNLKTIASILYHSVLDFFKGKVPIQSGNQKFLPPHLKIKPTNTIMAAPTSDEAEQASSKKPSEEAIQGLYTKKELEVFFSTRAQDASHIKGMLEQVLRNIYKITHRIHLENKAKLEEVKSP